jgi:hypothetical protein
MSPQQMTWLAFLSLITFIILLRRIDIVNNAQKHSCPNYVGQCESKAPFIFDSVFSLLKQWPNSYSPNGHSIVPGYVPISTPLYHVHYGPWKKGFPKFFSFDAYAF